MVSHDNQQDSNANPSVSDLSTEEILNRLSEEIGKESPEGKQSLTSYLEELEELEESDNDEGKQDREDAQSCN